jgi:hypothetical protein
MVVMGRVKGASTKAETMVPKDTRKRKGTTVHKGTKRDTRAIPTKTSTKVIMDPMLANPRAPRSNVFLFLYSSLDNFIKNTARRPTLWRKKSWIKGLKTCKVREERGPQEGTLYQRFP